MPRMPLSRPPAFGNPRGTPTQPQSIRDELDVALRGRADQRKPDARGPRRGGHWNLGKYVNVPAQTIGEIIDAELEGQSMDLGEAVTVALLPTITADGAAAGTAGARNPCHGVAIIDFGNGGVFSGPSDPIAIIPANGVLGILACPAFVVGTSLAMDWCEGAMVTLPAGRVRVQAANLNTNVGAGDRKFGAYLAKGTRNQSKKNKLTQVYAPQGGGNILAAGATRAIFVPPYATDFSIYRSNNGQPLLVTMNAPVGANVYTLIKLAAGDNTPAPIELPYAGNNGGLTDEINPLLLSLTNQGAVDMNFVIVWGLQL